MEEQALRPRMHQSKTRKAVDGFLQPGQTPARPSSGFVHPRQAAASPRRVVEQSHARPHAGPVIKKQRKSRGFLKALGQAGIIFFAIALGFLGQSEILGQAILLVYAIVAFILRIPSRTTFLMALISLGVVLIASVRSQDNLAATFASYVFLLLVIGTISLVRELRDEI